MSRESQFQKAEFKRLERRLKEKVQAAGEAFQAFEQEDRAKGAVAEVSSYIDETILTASADGEVTEIFPKAGELVGTGAPIMNVARLNDM